MYGFEAINAANGWFVVLTGLGVVILGMVILALFVANVDRILGLWDRREELFKPRGKKECEVPNAQATTATPPKAAATPAHPVPEIVHLSVEEAEVADYFHLITQRLGEPFSLPRLLEQAEGCGISNPYRHLDIFLKLNLTYECGGENYGFYRWRKDVVIVAN